MKRTFLAFTMTMTMILFASCKKSTEKEQVSNEVKKTEEVSKQLEIRFSFKTNKTDVFKIMMNNIEVDEFQKKNIQIFETIPPSSQFENIVAKFDEGNMSKNIVFSLGNKKVKEVTIDNINISYKNKVIDISTPKDITKFLRFNKHIKRDSTSKIIKTKKVDGKHSPTFTFSKNLIKQLDKD